MVYDVEVFRNLLYSTASNSTCILLFKIIFPLHKQVLRKKKKKKKSRISAHLKYLFAAYDFQNTVQSMTNFDCYEFILFSMYYFTLKRNIIECSLSLCDC